MTKILALLPLALTMNLGPQIITAIVVLTGQKPVKKSLIYLAGIAIAIAMAGFAAFLIFNFVLYSSSTHDQVAKLSGGGTWKARDLRWTFCSY